MSDIFIHHFKEWRGVGAQIAESSLSRFLVLCEGDALVARSLAGGRAAEDSEDGGSDGRASAFVADGRERERARARADTFSQRDGHGR